jgi:hypothetical protein
LGGIYGSASRSSSAEAILVPDQKELWLSGYPSRERVTLGALPLPFGPCHDCWVDRPREEKLSALKGGIDVRILKVVAHDEKIEIASGVVAALGNGAEDKGGNDPVRERLQRDT